METIFFLYGYLERGIINNVILTVEVNPEFYGEKIGTVTFKHAVHGRRSVFFLSVDLVKSTQVFKLGVSTQFGMEIVKISDEKCTHSPQEGQKTKFNLKELRCNEETYNLFYNFFRSIAL